MTSNRHGPLAASQPRWRILLALLVLCLFHWHSCHGISSLDSLVQVQVASPLVIARKVGAPHGLDLEKLKACAPKVLEKGRLDEMIQEASEFTRSSPKKLRPRRVPDEMGRWLCNECEQMLPEDAFGRESKGRQLPSDHCKNCKNRASKCLRRTLRGSLLQLLSNARGRAKLKQWEMTLTLEDLLHMLRRQDGKCAYSRVSMEMCMPHNHWRISLERRNNSKGYTLENCVLVAGEFNTGDFSRHPAVDSEVVNGTAQWSRSKVLAVFQLQQQTINLVRLKKDIGEARAKPCAKRNRRGHAEIERQQHPGCIYCSACNSFLEPGNFTPSHRYHGSHCKTCVRERNFARRSALRGHVQKCLASARQSAKRRCQAFALTLPLVLDVLSQQEGRCFYSGVPLEYKRRHVDWRLSIERLNNSVGYIPENCVLIAVEFNTADQSRNKAVTEVFGTAQWSREKVWHIWRSGGSATKLNFEDLCHCASEAQGHPMAHVGHNLPSTRDTT